MKSSRSSSQLIDGGAAGGVVWLDEPLGFPFLSFYGSTFMYRGRNIMCWRPWFGGHEVIHVVITICRYLRTTVPPLAVSRLVVIRNYAQRS